MSETVFFAVDSMLLRELGERLVGKPHIALAELIKNAYDADARHVWITMAPEAITVADDGHGMTFDEFTERWMRIGTAHKTQQQFSRELRRPLTGSKGVGRLSVQILANELQLHSIAKMKPRESFLASVDWKTAVQQGNLTEARAEVERDFEPLRLPNKGKHGTVIRLLDLQQTWNDRALLDLAREIWPLQPPFKTSTDSKDHGDFTVHLETGDEHRDRQFAEQMEAVLGLWTARIVVKTVPNTKSHDVIHIQRPTPQETETDVAEGDEAIELSAPGPADVPSEPRTFQLSLTLAGQDREVVTYRLDDCFLDRVRFEIRVFNLRDRQPSGISVSEARAYLRRFGGVHVYDAGFHLPYYGPDTDWLHIEMDHSHRLSKSPLLPKEIAEGSDAASPLQYLPTNSRLFGAVHVDTSHEQRAAQARGPAAVRESLSIQISRDRLADTQGYRSLVQVVRFALDLYAIRQAQRAWEDKLSKLKPKLSQPGAGSGTDEARSASITPSALEQRAEIITDLLDEAADALPEQTHRALAAEIRDLTTTARIRLEHAETQVGLLGALATAGITALAQEHEAAKQNALLLELVRQLRSPDLTIDRVPQIANDIQTVVERAAASRRLFSHLLDQRSRESRGRFRAAAVARSVADQLAPLSRGVPIDTADVASDLMLPEAGYAEWVALLQNVYVNALNAVLDSPVQQINVDGARANRGGWLRIQDTGVGVDLATAEQLFRPFERRLEISAERRALGLGGTGLGLTIVRMLATDMGATVAFTPPADGYSTALTISWSDA